MAPEKGWWSLTLGDVTEVAPTSTVTASVAMTGQATISTGYLKVIFQGGPIDGEQQIVGALDTSPGALIYISLPSFQTFAPDGLTVTNLGLTEVYQLLGPGPPPVPANGDTWTASWIFTFVGLEYVPRPPIIPPGEIPAPPTYLGFVSMYAESNMEIDANDPTPAPPGPTQVTMTSEGDLTCDLVYTPSDTPTMEAVTVMVLMTSDFSMNTAYLEGDTSMTVTPN